jgi:ArsR family transcriptional regulator, arsenate/arsenite/antimonite-responsive transcriptional repressor
MGAMCQKPDMAKFQRSSKFILDSPVTFPYLLKCAKREALAALAALAQDNRLDIFRLLVEAGPEGMPAGGVATALKLAPNTLTFHFDRLRESDLITVRREGRSMIYAARFDTMNGLLGYLTENCCQSRADRYLRGRRSSTIAVTRTRPKRRAA